MLFRSPSRGIATTGERSLGLLEPAKKLKAVLGILVYFISLIRFKVHFNLYLHDKWWRTAAYLAATDVHSPLRFQIKDGSWRSTTIEVDTPKTHRLPVLDVAAYDIGGTGEEFGLEFGRVCFS